MLLPPKAENALRALPVEPGSLELGSGWDPYYYGQMEEHVASIPRPRVGKRS